MLKVLALFLCFCGCRSVPYRTMKLFFIGKGQRGKTTLLHRLKESSAEKTDRTVGIEIEDWECRGEKKMFSKFRSTREPVKFIAWDFAGQVGDVGSGKKTTREDGRKS